MNVSQLLEALKSGDVDLTIGEKFIGGLSVAALSMAVVFIVLVVIAVIIKMLQIEKKEIALEEPKETAQSVSISSVEEEDESELIAVISAAICSSTQNSPGNIVVRKIVRTNNSKSSWENMHKIAK